MSEKYKTYKHNPPHLFRSNAKYFITGSTYQKVPYLRSDRAKQRLLKSLFKGFTDYDWKIEDWVILNNHYHLMVEAPSNAETLSKIIRDTHKFTALWIKKNINLESKEYMECSDRVGTLHNKIFHNYWDTCITYENSYYARLNYIWSNPVKHGYVEDAAKWKFGSYYYRQQNSEDNTRKLNKIIKNYLCDEVNVNDMF